MATDATDPRNKFAYALTFLEKVKDVFTGLGRPFIYQEFLGVMKEYKTQTYVALLLFHFRALLLLSV
jgi:histone deacetylase complex regulatory component SIN3